MSIAGIIIFYVFYSLEKQRSTESENMMKNARAIQRYSMTGKGLRRRGFCRPAEKRATNVEARRTVGVRLASTFHMESEPGCPAPAFVQSATHSSAKARSAGQSAELAAS